ncbi:MAG: hypothetical protein EA417_07415 [Gammaproteobacteria bacterium]|nr:MAG: hypothetical protein EA417_07415 [Gammaproteobacteria bacterium]
MTVSALIALVLAALCLYAAFSHSRRTQSDKVFNLFQLDPDEYELLGFDLGDGSRKVTVRGLGLIGAPDALFRRRRDGRLLVGDFKTRRFRGNPSKYERFQMVLYMGVASHQYQAPADALLRYACGHLEPVDFDPGCFEELRAHIGPLLKAEAKFDRSGRRAPRRRRGVAQISR